MNPTASIRQLTTLHFAVAALFTVTSLLALPALGDSTLPVRDFLIDVPPPTRIVARVGPEAECQYATLEAALEANTFPIPTEIWISNRYTETVAARVVRPIRIRGGYVGCTGEVREGRTTLTGTSGAPILFVGAPGAVLLDSLKLTGGRGNNAGGAIKASDPNLVLTLERTEISGNRSELRGGGIEISKGRLILDRGTQILRNQSLLGGGVSCLRGARLEFRDGAIAFNRAEHEEGTPRGGGIYASNCIAEIHAGGLFGGIFFNQAQQGGGIFASNASQITLRGTSGHAAGVTGNLGGGGILIDNRGTNFRAAQLSLLNAHVNGNVGDGVTAFGNATVIANSSNGCQQADRCTTISNNTRDGFASRGGRTFLTHVRVEGNAGYGISNFTSSSMDSITSIRASLIAENRGGVYGARGTSFLLVDSTVVSSQLYILADEVFVRNSLIWTSGELLAANFRHALGGSVECSIIKGDPIYGNVSHDRVFDQDPRFVDAAAGDYHVLPISPAVDRCPPPDFDVPDLDFDERGVDIPGIGDPSLPYDIGADEVVLRGGGTQPIVTPRILDDVETSDVSWWSMLRGE